jgi:hydroxypyruvate reductase
LLVVGSQRFDLAAIDRIVVVGAGKAGAGMAAALEAILGPDLVAGKVSGWVNVPEDCVRPLSAIHLHAARPAGVNEPTVEGVAGSRAILKMVSRLTERDLCLVLISGGGSALLPAPAPGVTLEEKQAVTRFLMHAGATIHELNAVRKQLSAIKGGGLARAAGACPTVALVISDVPGDSLETIASGPTVQDDGTPAQALAVLEKFGAKPPQVPSSVLEYLRRAMQIGPVRQTPAHAAGVVTNLLVGTNATAVEAAIAKARGLGFEVHSLGAGQEGEAAQTGRALARLCRQIRGGTGPLAAPACIISGGEPVVRFEPGAPRGKGGRNQEVALASMCELWEEGLCGLAILSGGTDGEDGPTDAAGACADQQVAQRARALGLDPEESLARHDAYTFFDRAGGLIKTGPTHTNVMDLRVALVGG